MTMIRVPAVSLSLLLATACGESGGDTDTGTGSTTQGDSTDTTMNPQTTTASAEQCADEPLPEAANERLTRARLAYSLEDKRYTLWFDGKPDFTAWFSFGLEGPSVGTLTEAKFSGSETNGPRETGASGTATLELVSLTETCAVGQIRDVVMSEEGESQILNGLPGGFVAHRLVWP